MKNYLHLCVLCFAAFLPISSGAQTAAETAAQAKYRAQMNAELGQYNLRSIQNQWLRVIAGQTNNLRSATNWITLPEWVPVSQGMEPHRLKVVRVLKQGVVADEYSGKDVLKTYMLKNLPHADKLLTGDTIDPIRVTRTGRTEYGQDTIPVFDYGIPISVTNKTENLVKP